jgi:DNA anti-recombination protein RmuC
MPVTAKLSRRFYEKLGDEVTNELADWLNLVDQSYRREFRELFEAHFSRLETRLAHQRAEFGSLLERQSAELGSRIAQQGSELESRIARQGSEFESRLTQLGSEVESRFAQLGSGFESRFAQLGSEFESRFAQLGAEFESRFARFGAEFGSRLAAVDGGLRAEIAVRLASQETRLIRWMFGFWVSSWIAVIGALVVLRRL